LANLHNARRARTPLVNVVGDHALAHKVLDAPLESDIDSLAGTVSVWLRRSGSPGEVGADAAAAVRAACAPPGGIATLILPADVSWSDGAVPGTPLPQPGRACVAEESVAEAALALSAGEPAVVLLGGPATLGAGLEAAGRVARASGARLFADTFPARLARGCGRVPVERLGYFGEMVAAQLSGVRHVVLAGTRSPVSFFAYPGRPGNLVPEGAVVHSLAGPGQDIVEALERLGDRLGAERSGIHQAAQRPDPPTGDLTAETLALAVGALLPEGAIVVDEANTAGVLVPAHTAGAPPHDVLAVTGGAIGQGLPVAAGAAVACPDRPVLCLEADGSAMYTLSALWTHAREALNVTTVVLSNRSYGILNVELHRVGAHAEGPRAKAMLDISGPELDFAAMAAGMGVPGVRVHTAEEFTSALARALAEPGPHLVEAVLPPFG
jgi:acetolactate synthase-1/2/3 large subunit